MLLLDLLPELLSQVFEIIVLTNDVDISLYLRPVCKRFDEEILRAICNTRRLDIYLHPGHPRPGAPVFLWKSERLRTQYLIVRTTRDRECKEEYSKIMKATLDFIVNLDPSFGLRREEFFRALCACTARSPRPPFGIVLDPSNPLSKYLAPTHNLVDNALAAILYLRLDNLLPWCLENGSSDHVTFFGVPINHIFGTGDLKLLCFFLHKIWTERGKNYTNLSYSRHLAYKTGNIEILKLLEHYERTDPTDWCTTPKQEWKHWVSYVDMLASFARFGQLEACQQLVEQLTLNTTIWHRRAPSHPYGTYQARSAAVGDFSKRPMEAFWHDMVLLEACQGGQFEVAVWALDKGADPEIGLQLGEEHATGTLERAAAAGSYKLMKLLLAKGARFNPTCPASNAALGRAIKEGYLEIIQAMVESGFDLNERHPKRADALFLATKRGKVESIELVLKLGLTINIFQYPQRRIYDYAVAHGFSSIVCLFEAYTLCRKKLLELPREIVSSIIENIVLQDLDIALYLRVVSKRFNEEIMSAVLRTGAMENQPGEQIQQYMSKSLISTYLWKRTLADRLQEHSLTVIIQAALDYIVDKRPDLSEQRDSFVLTLCQAVVLEYDLVDYEWDPRRFLGLAIKVTPLSTMTFVLAALAHLGLNSLFEACLETGISPSSTIIGEPLQAFAAKGNLEMVTFLLGRGFGYNSNGSESWLDGCHSAAINGHIQIMQLIFDARPAYIRVGHNWRWYTLKDWAYYGQSLLCAAQAGREKMSEYLVQKLCATAQYRDCDLIFATFDYTIKRCKDEPQATYWYKVMLYEGARRGKASVVEWALDHGADPNATDITRRAGSALDVAAASGSLETFTLLLKRGGRGSGGSGKKQGSVFLRAIREEWVDIIRYYGKVFDVNKCLLDTSPLIAAVKRGKIESLKTLFELGLKVDLTVEPGKGAWELASNRGYTSIAEMLNRNARTAPKAKFRDLPIELSARIIDALVLEDLEVALSMRAVSSESSPSFPAFKDLTDSSGFFNQEILASLVRVGAFEPQEGKTFPYCSTPFLARYLFQRTRSDGLRQHKFSKKVGKVLDYILEKRPEDEVKREEYLEKLCHATIRVQEPRINFPRLAPSSILPRNFFGGHMQLVMAAAAILDLSEIYQAGIEGRTERLPTFLGDPVELAAEHGDIKSLALLLGSTHENKHSTGNNWNCAIDGAAAQDDPTIFQAIFDMRDLFDGRRSRLDSTYFKDCLEISIAHGKIRLVQYLVGKLCILAPYDVRNKSHRVSAIVAPILNEPESTDLYWYNFVLWRSSLHGQQAIAEWAIANGAKVNSKGQTVLESAIRSGSLPLFEMLIAKGAVGSLEPQITGPRAFLRAVSEGWLDLVRACVKMGYDPNVELKSLGNFRGGYPLMAAVRRGKVECVRLLIELGLKVTITCDQGKEVYEHAVSKGYTTIVALLETASV